MQIEQCYGKARRKVFPEFYGRKVWSWILFGAFLICLVVNLAVGGKPWSGIVGISIMLFFAVCIDRPLLENTFLNRLQRVFIWVGILLIYMALFYSPKLWHALTIVLSSEVLFIDVLLLIFAPWRTKNTLRLSFILFTVLVESAALAVNIVQADWVGFLLFGLAMSFSFAVVLVCFRELKSEIRWRIFGG